MKLLRYLSLMLLLLSPLGVLAQGAIDAAIATLEKSKSVTNVVFSERRDPSSKAVIRSNQMFNFDNDKIAEKIIEAIKKERSKAVAFQMNTSRGEEVYTASFEDSSHMFIKYVLIHNPRGGWVLSVDKSRRKATSTKDRSDNVTDSVLFDAIQITVSAYI